MPNNQDPTEEPEDILNQENDPDQTVPVRKRDAGEEHFSFNDSITDNRIGRYLLIKKIGQGAFGVVYQAVDELLNRQVAIKVLTRFSTSSQADAWVQEARVLANLDHPSIVPVYDVGKTEKGLPYIVSKLIDGGNLGYRASKSIWSMDDSIRIITQLAQALVYLHQKGVMHRDIKPSNILTTASGDAVLVDFGLALPESSYGKGSRFVGTPAYMSPEQARYEGHRVDGRSDIYSLGVVFYELLTGSRPFVAKDQNELLECIRTLEVRPPRQLNSTVPKELERICLKSLSKRVSDRYLTAADLVEDLINWRSAYLGSTDGISVVRPDVEQATVKPNTTTVASEQSIKSLDIETVGVVPHGLRPFGQSDADFFKHLVPGVRDRNGIPDSINFWIQRIESRSTDLAFRIGVLMGPSGSGKSSLMRAGVLPQVSAVAQSVYLEARPKELESDLLKAIRSKYPQYSSETDLRELLISIRSHSNTHRPKLLLVIDQFEQWLNHHRENQITSLHEVLRQCDGVNVQAILLVRDDFLVGLSSFMEQLDESLLQNQNFATIEAFGVQHGRKVLAAFGRAFGTVNQPPTQQQEQFIQEAVDKLSETGRLQPVQIALLSDMLKSKPWSPNTLRELGGIQGLEVAFLEERLAGSSANPLLRGHLELVQRILKELLPVDGGVIKPPACAHSVLMDRLKGVASEELLTKLLHLIDTEVRLITPSSRTTDSASGSTNSSALDPAYQLTHDHLVITIRQWLNSRNLSTRAGRAAEQLHEISAMWNAKPSTKRLPSILEWTAIRWLIPKSTWTMAESRMMRAARQRFLMVAAVVCSIGTVLLGSGFYWNKNRQADYLVTRLLEAKTEELVPVLREVDLARSWVLPKLEQLNTADPRVNNHSSLFRIAAAKLDRADPKSDSGPAAEFVLDNLASVEDLHQIAFVKYIAQNKPINPSLIVDRARQSLVKSSPAGIAQAALLCLQEPENSGWSELVPLTSAGLLRKPSGTVSFWPPLFAPIRQKLVGELLETIQSPQRLSDLGNDDLTTQNFSSLMVQLAGDDPKSLARAAKRSPPNMITNIIQSASSPQELSVELRLLLAQSRIHDLPRRLSSANDAKSLEDKYSGRLFESGGWLEKVPLDALPDCLSQLSQLGLGVSSARPFRWSGTWQAALTLGLTNPRSVIETGLSDQQLLARFEAQQQSGYALLDFACYEPESQGSIAASTTNPSSEGRRWIATWAHDPSKANSQVLVIGESSGDLAAKSKNERVQGLVQLRYQMRLESNGETRTDSLWGLTDYDVQEQIEWSRLRIAAGDLYPGYLQSDIRSSNTSQFRDRGNSNAYADTQLPISISNRSTAGDKAVIASRLSSVGRSDAAIELLNSIAEDQWQRMPVGDREEKLRTYYRHKGRCLARLQRVDELRELIEEITLKNILPERDISYLQLQLAILGHQVDEVTQVLADLQPAEMRTVADREVGLRTLASIASQADWLGQPSQAALELLVKTAGAWSSETVKLQDSLVDVDFDRLRQDPRWSGLTSKAGLSQRFSACHHACNEFESRSLLGLETAEHNLRAEQLLSDGYLPSVWHVHNESNGDLVVSSVWVRKRQKAEYIQRRSDEIAAIILSLGRLNEFDVFLDGLNEKWGRTVHSNLVEQAPRVLPSESLMGLLKSSTEQKTQADLLSVIGGYSPSDFSDPDLRYLQLRLTEWSTGAKEISLMNMARFSANRLIDEAPPMPRDQSISSARNWYTNSLGLQFAVIKPPNHCLVGKMDERRIQSKIGRDYAISTTEISGRDFQEFYRDSRFQSWMHAFRQRRWIALSESEFPQNAVSWLVALQYCQWLNEREKIPADQWCYENVWGEQDGGPTPNAKYLTRTGYRLPTHAEWEWASSAGSPNDVWSFGSSPRHSPLFEWTIENAKGKLHPVGQLRPNQFGLFDIGGSVAEWTDDYEGPYLRSPYEPCIVDEGNLKPAKNPTYRILAGGRYKMEVDSASNSTTALTQPEAFSATTGFRIARTVEVTAAQ